MSIQLKQGLIMGLCVMAPMSLYAAVKQYHLTIEEQVVNVTGKPVKKITVNGQFPAPKLEFVEGDEAEIHVHNHLKNKDSSIHWHGLLLPGLMDGVPGFNQFQGIKPSQAFVYKFKVRQSGTYWYHAHSKGQEQDGLYGPLVIYPKSQQTMFAHEQSDRDYVVMLSDFHLSSSDQIFANLKKSSEYYQNRRETVTDVWKQIQAQGLKNTWKDRSMWNQMRMLKTDLSDVTGYTFLMNGRTPQQNWTGLFRPKEKIKLRFINASAMSFFDVRIPNLKMTVISADGQPVKPVQIDEFRIGTAETYDVIVEPTLGSYQIEAESIDRTGFAVGTLLNEQNNSQTAVNMPKSRPRALLNMSDMGHEMNHDVKGSEHHSMPEMSIKHGEAKNEINGEVNEGTSHHAKHDSSVQNSESASQSTRDTDHHMHGASHDAMSHEQKLLETESHNKMAHDKMSHQDMSHQNTGHQLSSKKIKSDQPAVFEMQQKQQPASDLNTQNQNSPVYGWANASTPEGKKALQYADLQSLQPQKDVRPAERELVIRLGGNMERYIWTINGKKFTEAPPLNVKYGERIRLKFINDSMMAHPMHLHGMFMQLENGQTPENLPNKHTIVVPPAKTVTALLTADEIGEWAIHCHLLYHMSAGMMNKLVVAKVDEHQEQSHQPNAQTALNPIHGAEAHGAVGGQHEKH